MVDANLPNLPNLSKIADLSAIKLQYISLRDVMVVPPNVTKTPSMETMMRYEISELKFKDNLLKIAAKAYLQPTCQQSKAEKDYFAQLWRSFSARKRHLLGSIKAFIHCKASACKKFYQAQIMRHLNPHHLRFLQ